MKKAYLIIFSSCRICGDHKTSLTQTQKILALENLPKNQQQQQQQTELKINKIIIFKGEENDGNEDFILPRWNWSNKSALNMQGLF